MTWPQAVYFSIFTICLTLITIRAIVAIERIPKKERVTKLEDNN